MLSDLRVIAGVLLLPSDSRQPLVGFLGPHRTWNAGQVKVTLFPVTGFLPRGAGAVCPMKSGGA